MLLSETHGCLNQWSLSLSLKSWFICNWFAESCPYQLCAWRINFSLLDDLESWLDLHHLIWFLLILILTACPIFLPWFHLYLIILSFLIYLRKLPCVFSFNYCKLWILIWLIEYLLSFLNWMRSWFVWFLQSSRFRVCAVYLVSFLYQ